MPHRPADHRRPQAQDLAAVRRRRRGGRVRPDADSIYEIPLVLHAEGLDDYLVRHLRLEDKAGQPDLTEWRALVERIRSPRRKVRIALVGKYINLPDAYLSVTQALQHAGFHHKVEVEVVWCASDELEDLQARKVLETVDGVLVPGGFGIRGSRARSRRSASPASAACPTSASASACRPR